MTIILHPHDSSVRFRCQLQGTILRQHPYVLPLQGMVNVQLVAPDYRLGPICETDARQPGLRCSRLGQGQEQHHDQCSGRWPSSSAVTGRRRTARGPGAATYQAHASATEYKRAIVSEHDGAAPGNKGAVLRSESLYDSPVKAWHEAIEAGTLEHPPRKGRKPNAAEQTRTTGLGKALSAPADET